MSLSSSFPAVTAIHGGGYTYAQQSSRLPLRITQSYGTAAPVQEKLDLSKAFQAKTTSELGQAQLEAGGTHAMEKVAEQTQMLQIGTDKEHEGANIAQLHVYATQVSLHTSLSLIQVLVDQAHDAKLIFEAQDEVIDELRNRLLEPHGGPEAILTREEELREMHSELHQTKQELAQKDIKLQKATQEIASKDTELKNSLHIRKLIANELVNVEDALRHEREEQEVLIENYNRGERRLKRAEGRIRRRDERIEELEEQLCWANGAFTQEYEKFRTGLAARDDELRRMRLLNSELGQHIRILEEAPAIADLPAVETLYEPVVFRNAEGMLSDFMMRHHESKARILEKKRGEKKGFFSAIGGMFRREAVITSRPWK